MNPSNSPPPAMIQLKPVELAALLGLEEADAPYLATAPVRLPKAWATAWETKTGVRELTCADVAMLLSVTSESVYRYMRPESAPRLRHRVTGNGHFARRKVAPTDLVLFLRERNAAKDNVPTLGETPAQFDKRAAAERADALAACDGE